MLNEKEEKNMKNFSSHLNLSIREPQITKYGGDTRSVYVPSPPIIHSLTQLSWSRKIFCFSWKTRNLLNFMLDGTLGADSLHPAPTIVLSLWRLEAWQGGGTALVADGSMIYLCTWIFFLSKGKINHFHYYISWITYSSHFFYKCSSTFSITLFFCNDFSM